MIGSRRFSPVLLLRTGSELYPRSAQVVARSFLPRASTSKFCGFAIMPRDLIQARPQIKCYPRHLMKKIAALIAILSLPQSAFGAMDSQCGSIVKSKARLACYDKLATPAKEPQAQQPTKTTFPDSANPFSAEEARTNARLKGICRGC